MGAVWGVFRVVYAYGYVSENDEKRQGRGRVYGLLSWVPQWGLLGMAGWTAWSMLAV